MHLRHWTYALAVIATSCLSVPFTAQAGTIYQTGFESSEGYSTGQLSGQNGWLGSAVPVVESSTVFSGSQAVSYNTTGLSGQDLAYQPVFYDPGANTSVPVIFDIHFMESSSGTASYWNPLAIFGNQGFMAQIIVQPDGTAVLGLASSAVGSIPVARGTWNDFQMFINFQAGTVAGYVNSQLIGSGPFASTSTSIADVVIAENSQPGGDTGFFDQLSVSTATPEPGYAAATGIGLIVLWSRRKIAN